MTVHTLVQEQRLPIDRAAAWEFFSVPRNLDAITPPDLGFRILNEPATPIHEGQLIAYRIRLAPGIWWPWLTEIKAVEEGHAFVDEQRFGPYRFWHHRHTFGEIPGGTVVRDHVHYALGWGPVGRLAHALFVRRKLAEIFAFRRRALAERFGTLGNDREGAGFG